jgi:hypothetical protein
MLIMQCRSLFPNPYMIFQGQEQTEREKKPPPKNQRNKGTKERRDWGRPIHGHPGAHVVAAPGGVQMTQQLPVTN